MLSRLVSPASSVTIHAVPDLDPAFALSTFPFLSLSLVSQPHTSEVRTERPYICRPSAEQGLRQLVYGHRPRPCPRVGGPWKLAGLDVGACLENDGGLRVCLDDSRGFDTRRDKQQQASFSVNSFHPKEHRA